jgi:flagellar protein FliO/FliZ
MGVWLMSQLGVVALLAAGVWAALYVIKQRKRVGGVAPNSLRVMGSTSLGTRERAVMLQAGERVFLLGVTAQSVSLISELEPPSPPKPAATREPDKPTSPSPDAP